MWGEGCVDRRAGLKKGAPDPVAIQKQAVNY